MIDAQLLKYARDVAQHGVRTRYQGVPFRRRALPHPSAVDHVHEIMEALWKDAGKARVLLCADTHDRLLSRVISVSMARVPKQNPDRTLSSEGRLIWDGTFPNLMCPKGDHPPADQPRHEELARVIRWWKVRFPGIRVLLAKRTSRTPSAGSW